MRGHSQGAVESSGAGTLLPGGGASIFQRFNWIYSCVLAVLLTVSLTGIAVSGWAHVATLAGVDPGTKFRNFWVFQLVLFALLLPMIFELFSTKHLKRILRSPRWMKIALYSLLVYYGVNFYVFLYWSADHLDSSVTWRMFSSGWLLLFTLAAVYYQVRFIESRRRLFGHIPGERP